MEGALGVLYQGKQVGGFYNWSINLAMDSTMVDGWKKQKAFKKVQASAYWLLSKPNGDVYEARFYQYINDQLLLIQVGGVMVGLPDKETFNRKLQVLLEFKWMS